ncbi:serine protease [Deinococcus aetherius]|uniref:Serine protease n=1 Tax=Deinococcus aetherius TaxID=200252 RepID=A0ABN6RDZ3_9DEIO|nr:trypsin-like peptidase domain-containing protein [Deinococcus aetherius]BDP40854.1 serine protease [Deinococcus aetherius]
MTESEGHRETSFLRASGRGLSTAPLLVLLSLALGSCDTRTSNANTSGPTQRSAGTTTTGTAQNQTTTPAATAPSEPTAANPGTTQGQTQGQTAQAPAASGTTTVSTERLDLLNYEENTIDVVEQRQDGVVFVTRFDAPQPGLLSNPFGGPAPTPGPSAGGGIEPTGSGSGFFIDDRGFIITNNHVVSGASRVTVRLHESQREYPARVIATAPDYDLALLQAQNVPQNAYEPMALGNSDRVRVGQKAIAMGAPFGLEFTVTQGIVSAKNRVVPIGVNDIPQNTIQTDAAINPGNSGGPLVNSRGEVIGVNTQILSPAGAATGVGQSAGVGFAVPINVAKAILPRLRVGREVGAPRIGIVGFPLQALSPQARQGLGLPDNGVLVQEVSPGSPASGAGLRGGSREVAVPGGSLRVGGDIITRIEDQEVSTVQDLQSALIVRQPGDEVTLTVRRGGQTRQQTLTLAGPGNP